MSVEFRFEASGQQHVTVCDCGWRSSPFRQARLAGDAWDRHVLADHEPHGEGGGAGE